MKIFAFITGMKHLMKSLLSRSPKSRYEARHEILAAIANHLGFRLYNRNLMWMSDQEFLSHWRLFPQYKKDRIHERRFHLYYLAKSTKHLDGDTAECGVLYGAGSFLIIRATSTDERTHYIFDSFEGLSAPDERDSVKDEKTFQWKMGDLCVAEKIVNNNLAGSGRFVTYKGWIPSRFSEVSTKFFSFVHIDVDLYEPTHDSLSFFYSRMVPGGIIVCDDYGSTACPGAHQACNDFFSDKPEQIIHLTGGQAVIIKACK